MAATTFNCLLPPTEYKKTIGSGTIGKKELKFMSLIHYVLLHYMALT